MPLVCAPGDVCAAVSLPPVQRQPTMLASACTPAGSCRSTVTTPLTGKMSSATALPRLLVLPVVVMGQSGCGNVSAGALVDSGATNSFVGEELVVSAGLGLHKAPEMVVTLADGSSVRSHHVCAVPVQLARGLHQSVECRVV